MSSAWSGPNGAGKSTLLNLAVGLLAPTAGTIEVLGDQPASGPEELGRVGFVAQDTPTYSGLSVADHLQLGAHLNPTWDRDVAESRIDQLGLDPKQKAGKLSGGQRAQLALTLAVAKRPELLILDEPVASLDPLARREFLQILMETVADHGVSVVLSSHLVADLERVCDYLVVLVASRVQIAGPVDELLAEHHRLIGARRDPATLPGNQEVIEASHTERQSTFLIRTDRSDPRSGLDGGGGRPRRPRARLHGPGGLRGAPGPADSGTPPMIWLDLAPVPHADPGGRRRAGRAGRRADRHRSPSGQPLRRLPEDCATPTRTAARPPTRSLNTDGTTRKRASPTSSSSPPPSSASSGARR